MSFSAILNNPEETEGTVTLILQGVDLSIEVIDLILPDLFVPDCGGGVNRSWTPHSSDYRMGVVASLPRRLRRGDWTNGNTCRRARFDMAEGMATTLCRTVVDPNIPDTRSLTFVALSTTACTS